VVLLGRRQPAEQTHQRLLAIALRTRADGDRHHADHAVDVGDLDRGRRRGFDPRIAQRRPADTDAALPRNADEQPHHDRHLVRRRGAQQLREGCDLLRSLGSGRHAGGGVDEVGVQHEHIQAATGRLGRVSE
jgi:hypothetical protein